MQNTPPRISAATIGYSLPTTSSQEQRSDTGIEKKPGLGMGSGGATNGASTDMGFTSSASTGPSTKTLPANGKKTKGRVKIKMEFIDNKLRRYTTFSKRKTGIMKKAYELSTLTGTQVMLLVASETGHVYTFATRKLQPMITSEAGKALIQTCLNSPDPPPGPGSSGLDQRMSATGFEETDLTYTVGDDCEKMPDGRNYSSSPGSPNSTEENSPSHVMRTPSPQMVLAVVSKVDIANQRQQQMTSNNAAFATTLTTTPGGNLTPAVQIGSFPSNSESNVSSGGPTENSPSMYHLPTQGTSQPFALTISGTPKNPSSSSSSSQSSAQSSISVVQNAQQNLSLLPGNVVIPAGQTLLQPGSNTVTGSNVPGAFMYHTAQGLMYATSASLPEGVILNLGQEQSGTQQYISIPVSLSLTPQQQQQLIQVTQATTTSSCQVTGWNQPKKDKSKK